MPQLEYLIRRIGYLGYIHLHLHHLHILPFNPLCESLQHSFELQRSD